MQLEPEQMDGDDADALDGEEWLSFGMTTFCLAEAVGTGYPLEYLETLRAHHRAVEFPPTAPWREFGLYLKHSGSWANLHHAYLVWLAFRLDAYIVTRTPDLYLAGDKQAPVLPLEDPWDQ
ncbi:hypothetical protein [Catellatospora sp. NPDC049609]|uniref:hypothetical protein n=1 Tax=Catellatospora sp. NPDC049609 TaxID=3155505 RepID=UPI0034390C46